MGSVPVTTNPTVSTLDGIINNAVMTLALQLAEKSLETAIPELQWPIIKQLFEEAMKIGFQYVDTALEQVAALAIIDAQANAEAAAYQAAVNQLQTALAGGNQDAITAAQQLFTSTLGSLIHWDGS